jgi:UDP-N-acetylmuramoylalanine--D-glutamate ligase
MQRGRLERRTAGLQRKRRLNGIKDKKVTVVGLARSGVGAANLLAELGAEVTVTDIKPEAMLQGYVQQLNPAVRRVLGTHPAEIFLHADMLVISPGVPLDIGPLSSAKAKGIPVIGELELAYQAVYGAGQPAGSRLITRSKGGFLAITGANGKSTTTALLDHIMKKGGFRTILGGNIGNALTEEIVKHGAHGSASDIDFIVAELSSFQLESIKDFRPRGAAVINITPDHLDRYHTLEEYGNAKARIFENQKTDDFLILNRDDPGTMKVKSKKLEAKSDKPEIYYFSRKQEVEGIYEKEGMIYCAIPALSLIPYPFPLMRAEEIKIKGVHNLENAMAASAMALLAGCPAGAVIDALREFPGLEHRLEFVRELNGVSYFNDSKGTNVGAVMKSLESFSSPIILIAGGRDKAGDFTVLRHLIKERVKAAVLIGEAAGKMRKAFGDVTETIMAADFRDAVEAAQRAAEKGDVVLLSPACASFDMFLNFEDRGRKFKEFVKEMA